MNIEEMIFNGASEEEIQEALNKIKAEKARQEAALRAEQETQDEKEALKAEGRAYLINALIAYSSAFDLLSDGETWSDEDVAKAEELIKRLEELAPMYIKLYEIQNKFDEDFFGSFGLGRI